MFFILMKVIIREGCQGKSIEDMVDNKDGAYFLPEEHVFFFVLK